MKVNTLNFSHRFTLFAFKTNDNSATIPSEMNDLYFTKFYHYIYTVLYT